MAMYYTTTEKHVVLARIQHERKKELAKTKAQKAMTMYYCKRKSMLSHNA